MCGIAGLVDLTLGPDALRARVETMTETLRHRGPDDSGILVEAPVALGHRRLSILDLTEAGRQPMESTRGDVVVTFNGEIYNYVELREELEVAGHRFRTRTDTEVLLEAYRRWGTDMLPRLNGMFAFVLLDRARRELVFARDRMGKKPLYLRLEPRRLWFASEPRALFAVPEIEPSLSGPGLASYLTLEYVAAPLSILDGMEKLPAGTFRRVRIEDDRLSPGPVESYWQPTVSGVRSARGGPSLEEAGEALLEALANASRLRLRSDVPLGLFLSGGMDSSTLVHVLREVVGADVKTFSIGFHEKSFDESDYARRVAEAYGTEHHEEILRGEDAVDLLPRVVDILDEPMADPSIVPTFLLCRHARRSVTVALGGDGGDELLAGYDPFDAILPAGLVGPFLPGPIVRGALLPMVGLLGASERNMSLDFRLKQTLRGLPFRENLRHPAWLGSFLPEELDGLLRPGVVAANDRAAGFGIASGWYHSEGRRNAVAGSIRQYQRTYLQDDILTKVDRASMAVSLEVRAPFLDPDVVGLVNGLPSALKFVPGNRKRVLRQAVRGRLPDWVLDRPKKGFGMPVARWLRGPLRERVEELLGRNHLSRQGLFRPRAVARLVDRHLSGRGDERKKLWTLLLFQMWWSRWMDP